MHKFSSVPKEQTALIVQGLVWEHVPETAPVIAREHVGELVKEVVNGAAVVAKVPNQDVDKVRDA